MIQPSANMIVGVFQDREKAKLALRELKIAGFDESQIGVASPGKEELRHPSHNDDDSFAGSGAAAGAAAGAGVGALWGLGVLAGALPAIGPAIAGGTLAALLSSAAVGATAAGLGGALLGMGMTQEEADFYESEAKAGRTIVTVKAGSRGADALTIIKRFGGYDMSNRASTKPAACATMSHKTVDVPVSREDIRPGTRAGATNPEVSIPISEIANERPMPR